MSLNPDLAGHFQQAAASRVTLVLSQGNPMLEIKEPDWKALRRVHPLALERFCERVLANIDRVSHDGATGHHARYLQIFRILQ